MKLFGEYNETDRSSYYFFGLPIISKRKNDRYVRTYFLGIRISKQAVSQTLPKNRTIVIDDSHALRHAQIPMKSVLLVETHKYGGHGELLLPYAKYFLELGYSVDIITTFLHAEMKFASGYDFNNSKIRVFLIDFSNADAYGLIYRTALHYDLIIDTTEQMDNVSYTSFDDWYNEYVTTYKRNNLFIISHDAGLEQILKSDILNEKKAYASDHFLPSFSQGNEKKALLTVDYSFMVSQLAIEKKDITQFISLGRLEASVKDYDLLFDTMRALIKSGVTNFNVTLVCFPGNINAFDISGLEKYLHIFFLLSNERMFCKVNESHFVLSLLTPSKHDRYKTTIRSGSYCSSVGFSRPQLIEKSFADYYNYNDKDAIIYSDIDLFSAMKCAINMQQTEYTNMCNEVSKIRDVLIEEGRACAKQLLAYCNGE
jgi:hypothetical protein